MAKYFLTFLILTLCQLSLLRCQNTCGQTCTRFQAIPPSEDDIAKVIEGARQIEGVPYLLADYSNREDPGAALAKDAQDFAAGLQNEDANLTLCQLVSKYGYGFEEHTVVTEDGYILTLHRVPGRGMPVFIMHGTQGSSDDFVLNQEDSLVFLLVNAGYDVWLGNNRGNKYARKHIYKSPDCAEFWDFSWDEIGNYDLPASINYILYVTGQEKLHYIGFSQGTTAFFVMASSRPEYNAKIASAVTLATITYLDNIISPVFRLLAANQTIESIVLGALGQYEVTNNVEISKAFASVLCANNPVAEKLCAQFIYYGVGFDISELNFPYLYPFAAHYTSGCSANQLRHFIQVTRSGEFKRFDHGVAKNLAKYGCPWPPKYDLSRVTAKLTLFYGANDWVTSDEGISRMYSELVNARVNVVRLDKFSHVEYVSSKNLRANLFEKVVDAIRYA